MINLPELLGFDPIYYKDGKWGTHYVFRFENNRGLSVLPSRSAEGETLHGLWEARLLGFYGPHPHDRILEHAPSLGMLPVAMLAELLVEVRNMHPREILLIPVAEEEN
jgi:hypothetical protein